MGEQAIRKLQAKQRLPIVASLQESQKATGYTNSPVTIPLQRGDEQYTFTAS